MEEKTPDHAADNDTSVPEQEQAPPASLVTPVNIIIVGLVLVIVIMGGMLVDDDADEAQDSTVASVASTPAAGDAAPAAAAQASTAPMPTPDPVTTAAPTAMSKVSSQSMPGGHDMIERNGEGRLFYRTIRIPAGAETLYLSGTGASMKADGTWGNMEEQAIDVFSKFKATLEEEGWSMADIVQVRAFAVAGDYGLLDFDGFNRGYSRFFGTDENPNKPVRSFVQVADLVVDGWLVEVEIRAARMPR